MMSEIDERGLLIHVHENLANELQFAVLAKAVTFADDRNNDTVDLTAEKNGVDLLSVLDIYYCPFCGANLSHILINNSAFFSALAHDQLKYTSYKKISSD